MLVVIDTNIIVNALKASSKQSKAMRLLDDVFDGKHTVCVSSKIMEEYRDVLGRPYLELSENAVSEVLSWFEDNAYHIEPRESSPETVPMKDEDDRVFFDVAKCVNARLITRNHRDYPVHEIITLIDELYK